MTKSLNKINKIIWLIGGGFFLILLWNIQKINPSPLELFHACNALSLLPPLWMLCLLQCAAFFLMGGACLSLVCFPKGPSYGEVLKYKCAMFLAVSMLFILSWYVILFGTSGFFLSWLCLTLAILMAIITAWNAMQISLWIGVGIWLSIIWWGYVWMMQVIVILHI